MCGGRGSRLEAEAEKPLFEIGGRPMVERVLTAVRGSRIDAVHAAVSSQAPETWAHLESLGVHCLETPGDGYVEDLGYALGELGEPVLTVVADLPLLEPAVIDHVLDVHDGGSLAVYTPVAVKRVLGSSIDLAVERDGRELAPTGLNIITDREETIHVTYDVRLAVNVNRRSDGEIAEVLA